MRPCVFCGSKIDDKVKYGSLFTVEDITVHSYCLYLSSNLAQSGDEHQGILGFMLADIQQEVKRASHLHCCYCKKSGASIGCCNRKCLKSFHLVCGVNNGALNQFVGTFNSYCHRHATIVDYRPQRDEKCTICFENLQQNNEPFSPVNLIRSPCCQNGWYHKYCLQQYAISSGYFFKCPLCNNMSIFRDVSLFGIFVPDSDASWETEPNAFIELLERECVCHADVCKNVNGRDASDDEFIYCTFCGSLPQHLECADLEDDYVCIICKPAFKELVSKETAADNTDAKLDAAEMNLLETCFIPKNTETLKTEEVKTEYSDDEDPLEYFGKFITDNFNNATKNISCIQSPTRNNHQSKPASPASRPRTTAYAGRRHTTHGQRQQAAIVADNVQSMNISCVANRTRNRLEMRRSRDAAVSVYNTAILGTHLASSSSSSNELITFPRRSTRNRAISTTTSSTESLTQSSLQSSNIGAIGSYRRLAVRSSRISTSTASSQQSTSSEMRVNLRRIVPQHIRPCCLSTDSEELENNDVPSATASVLNVSCIAKRTRSRSLCLNAAQPLMEITENETQNEEVLGKSTTPHAKLYTEYNSDLEGDVESIDSKNEDDETNDSDGECLMLTSFKRKRLTLRIVDNPSPSSSDSSNDEQDDLNNNELPSTSSNINSGNASDISCVAKRTRRRLSLCSVSHSNVNDNLGRIQEEDQQRRHPINYNGRAQNCRRSAPTRRSNDGSMPENRKRRYGNA